MIKKKFCAITAKGLLQMEYVVWVYVLLIMTIRDINFKTMKSRLCYLIKKKDNNIMYLKFYKVAL